MKATSRIINADRIKWRQISPRSKSFYLSVRDHELVVVLTRGQRFSTMTMIHTWLRKQLVRTINCRGMSVARCLNDLMHDRGIVWKTRELPMTYGDTPREGLPPVIVIKATRRGRKPGFKVPEKTRLKMKAAQKKRRKREARV